MTVYASTAHHARGAPLGLLALPAFAVMMCA
jgi:hypothetical protein